MILSERHPLAGIKDLKIKSWLSGNMCLVCVCVGWQTALYVCCHDWALKYICVYHIWVHLLGRYGHVFGVRYLSVVFTERLCVCKCVHVYPIYTCWVNFRNYINLICMRRTNPSVTGGASALDVHRKCQQTSLQQQHP